MLPITIVSPVLGMAEGSLAVFPRHADKVRTTRGVVRAAIAACRSPPPSRCAWPGEAPASTPRELIISRDLAEAFATQPRAAKPTSMDLRLRNRRDQAFCVRLLVQAIDALFLAAGGQGLFLDHPLQRFWRDAHAAASHISLNWDLTGSMFGQYLLGLEPKGQY